MKITVAIVDDHQFLAQALAEYIARFDAYDVLFVAGTGQELRHRLEQGLVPDVMLLDINLAGADGFPTLDGLTNAYPLVRVLVLRMTNHPDIIAKTIRQGARGYLLKGARLAELRQALDNVYHQGFHYSDLLSVALVNSVLFPKKVAVQSTFNTRESTFLTLSCSDLTYVQIADKMCVAPRTVDGYREAVFEKLNVKSRTGMVVEAIRRGLVSIPTA